MIDGALLGAVLHISGVTIPQNSFEMAVGQKADRFEEGRFNNSHAQINIDVRASLWPDILKFVEVIGVKIVALADKGEITDVNIDLGFAFTEADFTISQSIPSPVVAALGRSGIGITVSFYPTSTSE